MANDDLEERIKEFELTQLYQDAEVLDAWHKICKISKPEIIGYSMDLISAFNSGKSIDDVIEIFNKQKYSGKGHLQTLNIVAEFTPGIDYKGIELFAKVEPEFVKQTSVAKKLESYKQNIKKFDNPMNSIKLYRNRILDADKLALFSNYIADAENGSSVLGPLGRAVQLMKAIQEGSIDNFVVGKPSEDFATSVIVAQVGGKSMLGTLLAKGMITEKTHSEVVSQINKENKTNSAEKVKKAAGKIGNKLSKGVDGVITGNNKVESSAKKAIKAEANRTKNDLGSLGRDATKAAKFIGKAAKATAKLIYDPSKK